VPQLRYATVAGGIAIKASARICHSQRNPRRNSPRNSPQDPPRHYKKCFKIMNLHHISGVMAGCWQNPLRHILRTLLPNRCLLCGAAADGAAVDGAAVDSVICSGCIRDLPQTGPACPRCAEARIPPPVRSSLAPAPPEPCDTCRTQCPAFDRSLALWRYDYPLDGLIGAFKYGHQLVLARFFGEQLAQRVQQQIAAGELTPPDVVLAMPLHPRRLAERGFNQSLLIAQVLSHRLRLPLHGHWLQRLRHTPPQTGLPWQQRAANLEHAFGCKQAVAGRHIAVVDDVMTTGSSLQEVARTLKLAGASRVDNWVLARTPPARAGRNSLAAATLTEQPEQASHAGRRAVPTGNPAQHRQCHSALRQCRCETASGATAGLQSG
jgi:ComF family protein